MRQRDKYEYMLIANNRVLFSSFPYDSFATKVMIGKASVDRKLFIKHTLLHKYLSRGRDMIYHRILKDKNSGRIEHKRFQNYHQGLNEVRKLTTGPHARYVGAIYHGNGHFQYVSNNEEAGKGSRRQKNDAYVAVAEYIQSKGHFLKHITNEKDADIFT